MKGERWKRDEKDREEDRTGDRIEERRDSWEGRGGRRRNINRKKKDEWKRGERGT